jgi:hypothetical protein
VRSAEALKDLNPKLTIGLVGSHVSICPEASLRASSAIDFVTRGEFVLPRQRQHVLEDEACGRSVHELAAGHQRRGMRQPGGKPEGAHLAPRLVAGSGAAVVAVEGRRVQEEGLPHRVRPPS